MKFGVWVPTHFISGWDPVIRQAAENPGQLLPGNRDPGYQLALETIQACDAAGFYTTLMLQRLNGPDAEAWIMASVLAGMTKKIEIMTAVQPGLWSPAMAAKMGASIDRMTGGRFAANVIAGWNEAEQHVYGGTGLMKEDPAARYRRAEEFIILMKRLWTEEVVSHDGEFYHLHNASVSPKPWNRRTPPVYAAARSEAGLEFVARQADYWFVDIEQPVTSFEAAVERTREQILGMDARAAKYGRKMRYAMQSFIVHDEDEAAARRKAESIHSAVSIATDPRQIEVGLIGSAARIAERVAIYEDVGLDLLHIKVAPWRTGIPDFVQNVWPLIPHRGTVQ
ncbi:MAG: alkanesulfonate monooxygenase [Firmicutes bacterium]|nr:alkanesulfonate monooxygenase [Bacillota bacterium]